MAELAESAPAPWTAAQSRAQLATIAWLRWRIFLNNFRSANKKRSATGLVMLIVLRVIVWGLVSTVFFIAPIAGCGVLGYYSIAHQNASLLSTLTWTVFSVSLFISVNVLPGTVSFDLTTLLRFPVGFSQYLLIRIFFGLFAIPTLIANLCLVAAAVGIGVADHRLFPWAALVLGVFALHNVFFIRMVFAWVDRWMATRRAREIFGGLVLFASLGFQLMMTGSHRGHRGAPFAGLARLVAPLHPVVRFLSPSLAADAILDRAHPALVPAYASLLGLVAFALVFLAIFAVRLKKEFRGENLSEAGRRAIRVEPRVRAPGGPSRGGETIAPSAGRGVGLGLPPAIAACVQKELIYLKRSGAQLYGLVTPLFFVFLLTRTNRMLSGSTMLFPYVVAYMMFGLLANLYNVLGADGSGFNLYLLAPVRLRDVLLAKNLVNTSVIVIEILLALLAVSLITRGLPAAAMLVATLLWAGFALVVNLTVGNLRSLLAPMRFELGKARRAPMAKGGALISLGVLFGTLFAGLAVLFVCRYVGLTWLATPIFLALDGGALFAYVTVLGRVDGIAASHRDELTEALCKS